MTFHIGQKVVCIDNSPGYAHGDPCPLALKTVYVVLAIKAGPDGRLGLSTNGDPGIYWSTTRFRPLVERKSETDISWAIDILDRVSKDTRSKEPV
jgi:hypothetical protein